MTTQQQPFEKPTLWSKVDHTKWSAVTEEMFTPEKGTPLVTSIPLAYDGKKNYTFATPLCHCPFGVNSAKKDVTKYDTNKLVVVMDLPDQDRNGKPQEGCIAFKKTFGRAMDKAICSALAPISNSKELWGKKKTVQQLYDNLEDNKEQFFIKPGGTSTKGNDFPDQIKLRVPWNMQTKQPNYTCFHKNTKTGKYEKYQGDLLEAVPDHCKAMAVFGLGQFCKVQGNANWSYRFKLLQIVVDELASSGGYEAPEEPLMDIDMDTSSNYGTDVNGDEGDGYEDGEDATYMKDDD